MEVIKTLKPGSSDTEKFIEQYGENLVAVRYWRDAQQQQQLITVELIVERQPTAAQSAIKLEFEELDLRKQVKDAGGRWDKNNKVWWLDNAAIEELNLGERIKQINS